MKVIIGAAFIFVFGSVSLLVSLLVALNVWGWA